MYLGILFSDYFCKNKVSLEAPLSPLTTKEFNSVSNSNVVETPSVKAALDISTQIALDLFEEPRVALRKTLNRTSITLGECPNEEYSRAEDVVIAVHNRIGIAPESASDSDDCFNPNVIPTGSKRSANTFSHYCRNWIIIANTCSSKNDGRNMLQITALPDSHSYSEFDDIDHHVSEGRPQFYLTSFITLPNDSQVTNIKFYGNDGNCTLTSETSPSNVEGTQSLSLLLQKSNGQKEIWLFQYDVLNFRRINLQSEEINLNCIDICKFDPSFDRPYLLYHCNEVLMEGGEHLDGTVCSKCE